MCLPLKRKLPNITSKIPPIIAMAVILLGWELVSITGIVPSYMLPSPVSVVKALVGDLSTILFHAKFTLLESFYGLLIGIALAHGLGMKVLAEGVEVKEQVELLRTMECDEIQGFYYARPLPYEVFNQMLEEEEAG